MTLMIAGCASGRSEPPSTLLHESPPRVTLHVGIDTKGVPLGTYLIRIVRDPAEARITQICPTPGTEFLGAPTFDPLSFPSQATRVTGYSLRQPPPRGPYRLLTIVFEQAGVSARSPVDFIVERLYDTSNPPQRITEYQVIQSRPTLDFAHPD
ncbi:MAG: hypothetical protein HYY16_14815 [Planctomycetes bacterium]|nr:hypothetical protein [Planctomycetota bacterium]